jgi:FAD:protein FMN transferase
MTGSVSFPALGSIGVLSLADPTLLALARLEVERVLAAFDRACSRFREDSELSEVNAAGGRPVATSPLLIECIAAALRAAQLTDGDVDPTVGGALIALGYDRDFEAGASRAATAGTVRIAEVPGWHTVALDADAGTVQVGPGVTLDLGATAKALAADRAAAAAGRVARCGTLVSLGGDIATAGAAPQGGWRIRVTDDHRAGVDAPGQWISIRSGGLATSSVAVRRWSTASGIAHHLVDPATSQPAAGGLRTVSVCAASCLDANIASTAAIVRGRRAACWLSSLGLPSRLVGDDGAVRHLAGWPPEGDDLPEAEDGV